MTVLLYKRYLTLMSGLYVCFLSSISIAQDFIKITNAPCVNDLSESYGSSFFDYDGDGDIDLYVANFTNSFNLLYANDGNGNFTLIGNSGVTSVSGSSLGHSWVDFDLDCDYDLYISNGGVNGSQNNHLFQNNNGVYDQIVSGAIPSSTGNSQTSNWGDMDNDGDLDLFVANLGNQNNFLFKNNGGGNFTSINTTPVTNSGGQSNDANWIDYDNDGDLDLFVANQQNQNNFLYRNDNGTFIQILSGNIVTDGGDSYGSVWGDYDNDGDFDLYVCNSGNQSNFLYRNDGNGVFTRILSGNIVTDQGKSYGAAWIDYDNDGFLDLFVANSDNQNNCLYKNNGNSNFTKILAGQIVNDGGISRSCNWADIDDDGDLDCYVTNRSNTNNFLYKNNIGHFNNWLNIRLESLSSNTDCIGVVIKAKATINGQPTWQMRHVSSKAGYCAQESPNIEFGFGDATIIDSITVFWPTSNSICHYTNVNTNQHVVYSENCISPITNTYYDTICATNVAIVQLDGEIYNWYSDSLGQYLITTDSLVQLFNYEGDTLFYLNQINGNCFNHLETLSVHIQPEPTMNLGNDTTLCQGQQILIDASQVEPSEYLWQDGSSNSSLLVNQSGTYSVEVIQMGCTIIDTISVTFISNTLNENFLKPEISICKNSTFTIIPDINSTGSYSWNNGSSEPTLSVQDSGLYILEFTSQCANATDSIFVSLEDCQCIIYVPNAFSPNDDGINDVFGCIDDCQLISHYNMRIFNRWGELVFQTDDPDFSWNGTYLGKFVQDGIYTYVLIYGTPDEPASEIRGHVNLIR